MQERLVVVQASLRARDQVHDRRRVGRDHARPRRLLGPVVEIEADVLLVLEVEAEPLDGIHANLDRALLRVRGLERREAAQVRDVVRRRNLLALAPEQPLEPTVAQQEVRGR